jgi:hypothetical protein
VPDRQDEDLVAELRALDRWLDVPDPADQRAAVRSRLARPDHRRLRLRLFIASAVAAAGTVAAIAPARAAVVDTVDGLLRVAGIEVRQEVTPPDLPAHPSPLPSLRSTALDEARRLAHFPVRAPAALGQPEQVLTADPDTTGAPRVITLTYRAGTVRFDQFDGTTGAFLKTVSGGQWVTIGTGWGVWLPGPHAVTYVGRDGVERTATARLATPTLIWEDGGVTYRLEGFSTFAEARAVAVTVS